MRSTRPEVLHVRTSSKSFQLPLPRALAAPDVDAAALARYAEQALGLVPFSLDRHAVDRSDQAVVIRPWATWG